MTVGTSILPHVYFIYRDYPKILYFMARSICLRNYLSPERTPATCRQHDCNTYRHCLRFSGFSILLISHVLLGWHSNRTLTYIM